jgi:hypothetical protein
MNSVKMGADRWWQGGAIAVTVGALGLRGGLRSEATDAISRLVRGRIYTGAPLPRPNCTVGGPGTKHVDGDPIAVGAIDVAVINVGGHHRPSSPVGGRAHAAESRTDSGDQHVSGGQRSSC